jgi:RecB family exonuclease
MEISMRPSLLAVPGAEEFEGWTREFGAAEKSDLRRQCEMFWGGSWGRDIRSAVKRYPELPFIFKTRHGLLKGQIDLVFQSADGRWSILDYKTNRISEKDLEATARRYEFQLALYACVFGELTGQFPSRGVLYFSAIGRPFTFEYGKGFAGAVRERLDRAHAELIFPSGSAKITA